MEPYGPTSPPFNTTHPLPKNQNTKNPETMGNGCWEGIQQMPSKINMLNKHNNWCHEKVSPVIDISQDFDHWILNSKSEYHEGVNYAYIKICKLIENTK